MYIPTWLIVIVTIVFFIYRSKKVNIGDIEKSVHFLKESIFSLEHFDSPHFIDVQDAFNAMEINYLRLKQRYSHTPEKVLEIAKDWYKYVDALRELKYARVMLDVDWNDGAFDRAEERIKEPSIIKQEVENKFKSLLDEDWQDIPPDYSKRMETMKKPDKKTVEYYGLKNEWKYYYGLSVNLIKLEEKRQKEKKEQETEKEKKTIASKLSVG